MRGRIFFLLLVVVLIAAFALPLNFGNANGASSAGTQAEPSAPAAAATTVQAPSNPVQHTATPTAGTSPFFIPSIFSAPFSAPAAKVKSMPIPTESNASSNGSYTVTFTETGLPAGTQWGVQFNYQLYYSTTNTLVFYASNGTYFFVVSSVSGYASTPDNGTLTISGSGVTQSITFYSVPSYSVDFVESGLVSGTQWTVGVNNDTTFYGNTNTSTTNTVSFNLTNGTYIFDVYGIINYNVSPSFGYIFVDGANVTQKIVFIPSSIPVYEVFLTETGYPGSIWNASLNGVNQSALMPFGFVVYLLPNGTYNFSVSTYAGYTAYPSNGTVTVDGLNITQMIYYYANSVPVSTVTFTVSNMHSGFGMVVEITNSSSLTNNVTLVYLNSTLADTVIAYLPVGNYLSIVGEDSNPSLVYVGSSYNISEVLVVNYLNITSSSPVTVNTALPVLYKVTLTEVNLRGVTLWGVVAASSSLYALITNNQTLMPGPTPIGVFQGNANLSLSQTTMTAYLPNGTYDYSAIVSAYAQNGSFNVTGANETVYIYFPNTFYTVTFAETGLPLGYYWSVTINGTTLNPNYGSSINFTLPNGTYSFIIGQTFGYQALPASGTVTVDGANISQTIVFSYTPLYSVTFTETGLPNGAQWSVTLNGSTITTTASSLGSTIQFYMATGNYSFTITSNSGYVLSPSSGTVLVPNAPVYVTVTAVGYGYSVTFTETGLPSGTTWYVNLSNGNSLNSSSSSITLELANGSYNYTVGTVNPTYSANSGSFSVSGSSQSVSVAFTTKSPVEYTVTFSESGLPSGTSWSVTLNGTAHSSTSANITLSLANGSYAFTVGNVSGYNSSPSSGNLTVSGSALTKTITFSKQSSTPKSNAGLSMTDYEIIGGVVVVAVIAGVAGVLASRRRKKP